jgi:two-component system, NtrC family, response regulator AtoC
MLLVSRDACTLRSVSGVSKANSWQLETAHNGLEALQRLESEEFPDMVLLDLVPEDAASLHALRWLRRVCPTVPVILLSRSDDHQQMLEALRLGARDFLIKPWDEHQLDQALKGHLAISGRSEILPPGEEIEKIGDGLVFVASSPAMRKLRAQVELLAQVNVPVLILGEKGSGKQTTAQLIHELSVRSGLRLVKVNCGALTAEQLEHEIFGTEHGNGTAERSNRFEFCHRGTVLLKEISEMPASLQARMVSALQRQKIVKRGDGNLDVRVLATNTSYEDSTLSEWGTGGELMSRLSAFTIHVPPLRQRKEDIPVLLGHFIKKLARQFGVPSRNLSSTVLETCMRYAWPGNVTELENFVKSYLILGDDSLILMSDPSCHSLAARHTMDQELSRRIALLRREPMLSFDAPAPVISCQPASLKVLVKSAKEGAEKTAIAGALDRTRWNRKAAARLLKISYRALLYKIHEYQMTPPEGYLPAIAAPGPVKDSRS